MARLSLQNIVVSALLLVAVAGCTASPAFRAGEDFYRLGRYDEAVKEYSEALAKQPDRHEFRLRLLSAKEKASQAHFDRGRKFAEQDRLTEASTAFRLALELTPALQAAQNELNKVEQLQQAQKLVDEADGFYRARRFQQAKSNLQQALQIRPNDQRALELLEKVRQKPVVTMDGFELEITSDKPITLKFKDANIRDVFNILSKLSGVNFIFDEDMRTQNVTVFLEEGTFPQALELLLKMNSLGKKVLNSKNIIIYPRTKDKDKKYDDQVIQTFYLSNIDAKKAVNMLRTMLQLRKIYVHEELNALVVRDTPDTIKLAQQILESADRADSEVVFDLELIEVNHSDRLDFGPKLSSYAISAGLGQVTTTTTGTGGTTVSTTAPSSTNLTSGLSSLETFYSLPTAQFDFLKTKTDAEVLANPRIRVKNREKSKVHIGSREPVVTVTVSGGSDTGTRQDNVQYVDVGVKLDIEPNIQLDDTIVTKLNLEVSNVSGRQTTASGTQVLTITTTNAQTALTLKNGERTIIGGLVRDDISKSKNTVAFLGELPLIGNLFSSHNNTKAKREILLSITPRIVRSVEMPRADVATIWSGGEDNLQAGPNFGAFAGTFIPATEQPPVAPSPAQQAPEGFPVLQQGLHGPPLVPSVIEPPLSPAAGTAPAPPALVVAPPAAITPPAAVASPVQPMPVQPMPAPVVPTPALSVPAPIPADAPIVPVAPPAPAAEGLAQVSVPGTEIAGVRKGGRVFFQGPVLVKVGEQFSLDVQVDEVENLYSAPLFVGYDGTSLTLVRAEEGSFLKQGGQTTIFTTSNDSERNQLIVGYKQGVGGKGASGSGTLFRLVFRATAAGKAVLDLNKINFRDPGGNRLSIDRSGLTVEIR
ncbi:MAG: secretin N-terminal domain-containing protein [Trichloromonadaceae bacterium]